MKGVLYFADDDNVYDIQLFDQMRKVKRVGVWPVGLVGHTMAEFPVMKNKKVIGWNSQHPRKFSIDFAGFAVNLEWFAKMDNPRIDHCCRWNSENCFISQLQVELADLEVYGMDSPGEQRVFVWHTKTVEQVYKVAPGFIV